MDRSTSLIHHNLYEFANAISAAAEETTESSIQVNKDLLKDLSVAYMHLYQDVYINQRIRPLKVLLPKNIIQ